MIFFFFFQYFHFQKYRTSWQVVFLRSFFGWQFVKPRFTCLSTLLCTYFSDIWVNPSWLEACQAISIAPKCNSNITCMQLLQFNSLPTLEELFQSVSLVSRYAWLAGLCLFWKIFFFRSMKQQAGPGKMPKSWFFEIHWTQGLAYPVESGYLKKSRFCR